MPSVKSNRVDGMVTAVCRIVKWISTKVNSFCAKKPYKVSGVKAELWSSDLCELFRRRLPLETREALLTQAKDRHVQMDWRVTLSFSLGSTCLSH